MSYLSQPAGGGGGADPNAIHVNVGGEINGIAVKAAPVAADIVVIEDSAALWVKKKVALDGADTTAIHDNVAAEINAVAVKAVPIAADLLLIEDSAAANAKKKITIGTLPGGGGGLGYTLFVQSPTASPSDAITAYFGSLPKAWETTQGRNKIYIRKAGTIKIAEIYSWSATAGSNEDWSLYIRLNGASDTLVATVSVSASERIFSNTGLSIAVAVGDYIEMKLVNPTWATNPVTTTFGGYIYIE